LSQGTNGGGRERSRGKEQKPGILQAEKMAVIMDSRK